MQQGRTLQAAHDALVDEKERFRESLQKGYSAMKEMFGAVDQFYGGSGNSGSSG